MSTREIADLIVSVNELTETVADKTKEIDNKVDTAVSDIIETITKNNVVEFYIDAQHGSDENSGVESSPLKTFKEAILRCPTGSTASIYLKRFQRHVFDGSAWCYALSLCIYAWGPNSDVSQPYHYDLSTPILEFNGTLNTNGSIMVGRFNNSVIIEALGHPKIYFYCAGQFILARSRIVLNCNDSAFCGYYNYLNPIKFSIRQGDIVKTSGYLARHGLIFSVDTATGFAYTDQVIAGATKDNTVSNVGFSL